MYHKFQVKVESQKTEKQNLTRLKDTAQSANCSFAQNNILKVRMEIKRQGRFTVKQRKPSSLLVFSLNLQCFLVSLSLLTLFFHRASAYSQPHRSSPPFNYRSAIHRIRVIEGRPVNQRRGLPWRWPQTTQEDGFNTRGGPRKRLKTKGQGHGLQVMEGSFQAILLETILIHHRERPTTVKSL